MKVPSEWICEFPVLTSLVDEINSSSIPEGSGLLDVKRLMCSLYDSKEVVRIFNKTLAGLIDEPTWDPPHLGYDGQLIINYKPSRPILVLGQTSVFDVNRKYTTIAATTLVCSMRCDGFDYLAGCFSRRPSLQIFEKDVALLSMEHRHCHGGDVVSLEPGDVFSYLSHGSIVCKLEYSDYSPITLDFPVGGGVASCLNMSTVEATQLVYLIRLAAQCCDLSSVRYFMELTEHSYYYVRWEALKALSCVSPDDAWAVLQVMRNDPHPEVRSAALRAISASKSNENT